MIESYTYDPYGNITGARVVGNPYYFTGRRYDDESGIYYYRARYYDNELGRFLQRDPIGYADSMNLYSYVRNNPVNFVDPDGLFLVQVGGALIGGTINAIVNYSDFKSGNISKSDYAKLIGVGAATGAISTLGGGILSGAILGGAGSATNNFAQQKIKNSCGDVDLSQVGKAFAKGLGVGALGGIGTAIGGNVIKYSDDIYVGSSGIINYGSAGGLIGTAGGTLLSQ